MTKEEAKKAIKDAYPIVRRAIEGGLFDDIHPRRYPDLDWRNCDRWEFREGKRRADGLLAGTGVEFHVPRDRPSDRAEHYRLRVRIDGNRWLQTVRHGDATYVVDAVTGRRA